ncbi:MAG: hypothetical protein ACOX2F_01920 [bacterium]
MVKHLIYIFIILFLTANFCWDGKPLWKKFVPTTEKAIENVMDGTEKTIKKGVEKVKEGAEAVKETIKSSPKADISDEDKEELNEIIKKSSEKEKNKK